MNKVPNTELKRTGHQSEKTISVLSPLIGAIPPPTHRLYNPLFCLPQELCTKIRHLLPSKSIAQRWDGHLNAEAARLHVPPFRSIPLASVSRQPLDHHIDPIKNNKS